MSNVTDLERLASKRVDRASSNIGIAPVDLLRAMVHDIETGALKCESLLCIWVTRGDGHNTFGSYRCNLTSDQDLATLVRMQHSLIRRENIT